MKSQPEKQGNQTMKFGQLIEYNTRNIFHEKSYTKCYGETISRLFFQKSQNSAYLWIFNEIQIWKFGIESL